jgi:bacteriocin-like protein
MKERGINIVCKLNERKNRQINLLKLKISNYLITFSVPCIEGDGKQIKKIMNKIVENQNQMICELNEDELNAIKGGLDNMSILSEKEASKEGDGKALVCCTGNAAEKIRL